LWTLHISFMASTCATYPTHPILLHSSTVIIFLITCDDEYKLWTSYLCN
jgi:hypothetical protein